MISKSLIFLSFYSPVCPAAVCEGCAVEGASDIKAIIAIDCHEGLTDCHAAHVAAIDACHEPLKDCYKTFPPTKECLIGPAPCIHEAKLALPKCVADNRATLATCIHDKKVSLAKADECLACAVACKKA